jgi:uncharacterized damage-inducible protein DinB
MCDHYLPKLLKSVRSLSTEQLWHKESEHLNSVGGIVLHICEHIKRNAQLYKGSSVSYQQGIEEFFPQEKMSPEELASEIERIFMDWKTAITEYCQQPEFEIDLHRLYHLIEHVSYHIGQVVDRVKRLTQISFQFCQNGLNEQQLRELVERSKE